MENNDYSFKFNNYKKYNNITIVDNNGNLVSSIKLNTKYNEVDYKNYLTFVDSNFANKKEFFKVKNKFSIPSLDEFLHIFNRKDYYNLRGEIVIQKKEEFKRAHSESSSLINPCLVINNNFLVITEDSYDYKESKDGIELWNSTQYSITVLNIKNNLYLRYNCFNKLTGTKILRITSFVEINFYNFSDHFAISDVIFEKYLIVINCDKESMKRIFDYPYVNLRDEKIVTIISNKEKFFLNITYLEFLNFIYNYLLDDLNFVNYRNGFKNEFHSFYQMFNK